MEQRLEVVIGESRTTLSLKEATLAETSKSLQEVQSNVESLTQQRSELQNTNRELNEKLETSMELFFKIILLLVFGIL